MLIFSGRANIPLSEKVCSLLKTPLGKLDLISFPNSEIRVELREKVQGQEVVIFQSLSAPVNEHLMELLFLIQAVKQSSAKGITAVVPFFAYSRQDYKTETNPSIPAKWIASLLKKAGVDQLIVLDLHTHQVEGFFDCPTKHLSTFSVFYEEIRQWDRERLTICAPDLGRAKWAHRYARALGVSLSLLAKTRKDHSPVISQALGEFKGRHILLIDDLIETGATLSMASNYVLQQGALSVKALVAHAHFTPEAEENLRKSHLEQLYVSDSIVPKNVTFPCQILSVSPLLAQAISHLHGPKELLLLNKLGGINP